jgi:hypothetical protein
MTVLLSELFFEIGDVCEFPMHNYHRSTSTSPDLFVLSYFDKRNGPVMQDK